MGRTLFAPVSFGLGDLVVSLPALHALLSEETPVWLVSRAPSQKLLAERIVGLAGVVEEEALALRPGDRLVDLRDHPLQTDYWWGSPEFEAAFGQLGINDILAHICADLGVDADFSRPQPLLAKPVAELGNTVLLIHETDVPDKRWPPDRWDEVAAALRQDGQDVAQVTRGTEPSPLDALAIPAVVLPTPGDVIDALTGCRGVIGIDTGLTHISAQQETPTVTVCRQSTVYFRPWSHCRVVRGGPCTEACLAAEARYAYNERVSLRGFRPLPRSCPSGSPCLDGTRPSDAVALLRELL